MGVEGTIQASKRLTNQPQSPRRPPIDVSNIGDALAARWAEQKPFYERNDFLVCVKCEKSGKTGKKSQWVRVFYDGPSMWAVCRCGARGRVGRR